MNSGAFGLPGRFSWGLAVAGAVFLAGCASGTQNKKEETQVGEVTDAKPEQGDTAAAGGRLKKPDAQAVLESRSGSNVTGHVNFYLMPNRKIQVIVEAAGLAPGKHGFHLHEKGDCSDPDGKSAGDHWNPTNARHGAPHDPARHAGDLGNIEAGADGNVFVTIETDQFTLGGDLSAIGKAVIIHERPDDLTSQPSGAAGNRVACGVVQQQ